jgi:hypothetical protein
LGHGGLALGGGSATEYNPQMKWILSFQMKRQDLNLIHVYMKSMLTRILKKLNNLKLCTSLDVSILNSDYKIDSIYFI